MSQLQVTGEAKIRDIQGPVVSNSGVITALDGDASQYVRGDGTLADFPTSTGGGSSVSYYLNSSVSQGTIGGVAYRQLGKTPISGAGTDITISTTGYIASYLTDANDPALLEVPAGNFNCEFYFSVNNNTGNPFVYAEVYKYDGSTFTLLGTSVGVPEYITEGTVINPYYFAIPVAVAALTVTDRIAIRIYVNVDGRTVTLHTENNHLCQVVTTFSKGLISLNNLTRQNQFFGTGTSGTDFAISSSVATHTFNLPVASAANTGKLSSSDWSLFNAKQAALSFTAPLVNTSNTISIPVATSIVDGYLDNLDWTNFNTAYNNMIVSAAVTGTTTKTLTLTQQDAGTITASWTDDNTDAVTSVFGRTGAVVAVSGDYNTSQVTENTNLYFTDARARLALSFTAGSGAYNSTTGVITIPTNNNQITNGSNFITRSSLTATTPLFYNNTTGDFTIQQATSVQNGYLSSADWTTFNSKQNALTNPVTGTGLSGAIPKFTTTGSTIGSSIIYDSGTQIGINTLSPTATLEVNGTLKASGVVTLSSTVTASSLIKSGGTSAQILAADGSVITAGTNITISGGTISASGGVTGSGTTNYLPKFTGASTIGDSAITDNGTTVTLISRALSGTSATFSGNVTAPNLYAGTGTGAPSVQVFGGASSNSIGASAYITLQDVTNTRFWGIQADASQKLNFWHFNGSWSSVANISSTGAATFSNALQVLGQQAAANYGGTGLNFDFTTGNIGRIASVKTTSGGSQLQFLVYNTSGTDVNALQIASTGAATFSSSIAATSATFSGNMVLGTTALSGGGAAQWLTANGTPYGGGFISSVGGVAKAYYYYDNAANAAVIQGVSGVGVQLLANNVAALTIATSGAATFSSSVTAGGTIIAGTSATAGTINFGTGLYKGIMDYSASSGLWKLNNQSDGAGTVDYYQFQADGTPILTMKKSGAATFSQKIQISAGGLRIGTSATENDRLIVVNGTDLTTGSTQYLEVIAPLYNGNITNLYGRLQYATCNGGIVSNAYMMYLGSFVGTSTFSNRWSLYQESTTEKNYFGGTVLIGTTTDNGSKLQVNGVTQTNGLALSRTSFSSSTTMTDAFFIWEFGGAIGQTLTLYSSTTTNMHFIKNMSSVSLTITAQSGGAIMGLSSGTPSTSITLGAFKTVQIYASSSLGWYIMYQTT
jgi:hypothetical protein